MPSPRSLIVQIIAAILASVGTLLAQASPEARPLAISEADSPTIDGDLESDPIWQHAAQITDLRQSFPNEQTAPSERTEIYLCYDSQHLYIAYRCYDSEPEKIGASIMQRDQSVASDDYVFAVLDPYQTERDGYYFRVNANGALGDGRITSQSTKLNKSWDAIWQGAGRLLDDGYSVEMAIPFQSLSFDPKSTTWNANFGRSIPRRDERIRWSGAYRKYRFNGLDRPGRLTGLTGMSKGLGIDFQPYAVGTRSAPRDSSASHIGDFGADLFWQVTPSLKTTFTYNTDFAEAEVDDRVVNTSRFPLFFPEKRDFFLDGQEYFEFGPVSSVLVPFHSRTLGLSNKREKVPITAGVKVAGRMDKLGIGLMATSLDSFDTLESDRVGIARFTYDVLEESRVGSFFTFGDARGNSDNWVGGFDFDYKNTRWQGTNKEVNLKLYQLTSVEPSAEGHAYGFRLGYPNLPFEASLGARRIEQDFRPGLGFVRRKGQTYYTRLGYEFLTLKSDLLRSIDVSTMPVIFQNPGYDLETVSWELFDIDFNFRSGDDLELSSRYRREVLDQPFEIVDGLTLPAGDYRFPSVSLALETSSHRPVDFELEGQFGEYWNGHRWGVEGEVNWRPSKYVGFETGADYFEASLEGGDFEVLIGHAGLRVTPNPRLSWNALAQWDNVSNSVGLNSRIRYIVKPGSDIFLVVNQGYDVEDDRSITRTLTDTTTKVGWTFRY